MDDSALVARQGESQKAAFARLIGGAGRVLEPAPGVVATLVAAIPDRSLVNSVLHTEGAEVSEAVLDELERAYADAGVRNWAVWTRPGEDALAARLEARGHVHDARPLLMAATLGEMGIAPTAQLDWEPAPDWTLLGALNDRAYGLPGDFERLGAAMPDDPNTRLWVARVDGAPAGCASVTLDDANAEVLMVAVVPEARGGGLSGQILRHALTAAAADGATTTSLESSAMGEPTYRALGYRDFGRLGMWEKRAAG